MPSFFKQYKNHFDLWGGPKGLLECQLGAYWAVWAHFTRTDKPAIVSLPIGTGRAALMMALSFGFEAERVLVVTPVRLLRNEIAEEFKTLNVLRRVGALSGSIPDPAVFPNESKLSTPNDWNRLKDYDVVIATPKTTSPREKNVCNPPLNLFDLIFLDEAHHAPAPTWAAILEAFKGTKCVLLTSTPYRRDKRTVNAPLIYHYPISRALKKGIYHRVTYHPVRCGGTGDCDPTLCSRAKEVWKDEGKSSKLLIHTNRIKHVSDLVKLYGSSGLKVDAVTSAKSWKANQATIKALRNGNLDGIVCAGMMGEGLALPEMKIAVLHSAPRSLPFTLQVVGRVPQFLGEPVGDSHLLADPEEVSSEMHKLHVSEHGWRDIIPELAEIVEGAPSESVVVESEFGTTEPIIEEKNINPVHLKPYFSVRIYRVVPGEIDLNAQIYQEKWPENVNIYFWKSGFLDNTLMLITGTREEPAWAKGTGIENLRYDLHIFYYNKEKHLLFEATTSEKIARRVHLAIVGDKASLLSPIEVSRLLHLGGDYFTVGMRNVVGFAPALPTYMTFAGIEVQAAIRPTHGRTFALGHALRRLSEDEVRGVSVLRGGVWAIKRDNVNEFRKWCDRLADELRQPLKYGPLRLAFSRDIEKLEEQPLAVHLDPLLLRTELHIKTVERISVEGDIVPYMEIEGYRRETGELECEFCFNSEKPGIKLLYSLAAGRVWQRLDPRDLYIELGDEFEGNLQYYLEKFPPILVMPEGGVIINRQRWEPMQTPGPLPAECFNSQDWTSCDITCEDKGEKEGFVNIQDWLEDKLKGEISEKGFIIKDHGKGEIADFVLIEPKEKKIAFYHCKAMKSAAPGANVADAYDVLGQACRNGQWILLPALMEELCHRLEKRKNSYIIPKDRNENLKEVADSFRCNEWHYQVVVVQPGFDCKTIAEDVTTKVHSLLVSTYELLTACHADFAVWGSAKSPPML